MPNIAPDYDEAKGVPIDAIIFGGRTRDREPLIRAILDPAEGIYDGLTLGAEATYRRRGRRGPAALRPDVDASVHVVPRGGLRRALAGDHRRREREADLRARELVPDRPDDGHFLWPGYRDNLRPLLWLLALHAGEVTGTQTPVGIVPTEKELDLDGVDITPDDLATLLRIDTAPLAAGDATTRRAPRASSPTCPKRSGLAHRRVASALDEL